MMTKHTLFILLATVLSLPLTTKAQTMDFEQKDYGKVSVYDSWSQSPFRKGSLKGRVAVVANPFSNADNGSAKVVALQRSRYGSNLCGARIDLREPVTLSPKDVYFHVLIHKPVPGRCMLIGLGKRTDRPGERTDVEQFWALADNQIGTGEWFDAVFPAHTSNGVAIYSLVVVPDMESTHRLQSDFMVYLDDITLSDNPLPRIERADYPVSFRSRAVYNRGSHELKAVALSSQTLAPDSQQRQNTQKAYQFLADSSFQVIRGEQVMPAITYKGKAQEAYVYVDWNDNGTFDVSGKKQTELVSRIVLKADKNEAKTQSAGSAFHIPAHQSYGFYRMRYKVGGEPDAPQGSLKAGQQYLTDGGAIIDVRLNVHSDRVTITDAQRNGDILDAAGKALGYKIPFGKDFKVLIRPENGFSCSGLRIRHGYNLLGDSLAHGTPQYQDVYVPASQFAPDGTYVIPGSLIDGDVVVEGNFVSINRKD